MEVSNWDVVAYYIGVNSYPFHFSFFLDFYVFNLKYLDAVQEKLLNEYEAELKTKKPSHAKKDSNASDDWEKLSNESK